MIPAAIFAAALDGQDMAARWASLLRLARAGHATLVGPRPGSNWDAQTWAIDALGIHAEEVDRDSAVAAWMKAATRQAEAGPAAAPDIVAELDWALAVIDAPRATWADATRACAVLAANADAVGATTAARARGLLAAMTRAAEAPGRTALTDTLATPRQTGALQPAAERGEALPGRQGCPGPDLLSPKTLPKQKGT